MSSRNLTNELINLSRRFVENELVNQLAEVWHETSVTLGGSVSYGEADKFSDLDLFAVTSENIPILPINAKYENKDLRVERGYTWSQLEEYLYATPIDAEKIFWGIQKAVVLHDPKNRYSKIQEKLDKYLPEVYWKKQIVKKWFSVFYCSKNGVEKALARKDVITAGIWKGKLLEATMELTFLLNRQYIPPTKWLHKKFMELPKLAGETDPHLKIILKSHDTETIKNESDFIWSTYSRYMKKENLLPAETIDKPWNFV